MRKLGLQKGGAVSSGAKGRCSTTTTTTATLWGFAAVFFFTIVKEPDILHPVYGGSRRAPRSLAPSPLLHLVQPRGSVGACRVCQASR
ncbi:hypothetical protein GQ53DRAFT_181198 [Thozetella sp. PMI_491]|nr:hypothetical protein GQ53DRAFT_181198 [Thozetella sp. PMI_491]